MIQKKLAFFSILVSIVLTACGFHLRGLAPLPPELNPIYVTSTYSNSYDQFMQQLRKTLVARKTILVHSPGQALTTLSITGTNVSNSQVSLSASQQARTYQVTYSISYTLTTASGKIITPNQNISASQNIVLQPNQLIDNTPQLQITEQQLIQQVITQLIESLTSIRTKNALQTTFPQSNTSVKNKS